MIRIFSRCWCGKDSFEKDQQQGYCGHYLVAHEASVHEDNRPECRVVKGVGQPSETVQGFPPDPFLDR